MKGWIALSLLSASACAFSADIAFSSFGPGNSFQTGTGWTLGLDPFDGSSIAQGDQFVSLATGNLTMLEVAVGSLGGPTNWSATLFANSSNTPGSVLGSWAFLAPDFLGSNTSPIQINISSGPLLTTGTAYWLVVFPGAGNTTGGAAFNFNDQSMTSLHASFTNGSFDGASVDTTSTFRVTVEAVPEPASMIALGTGLAVLLRRRRSEN